MSDADCVPSHTRRAYHRDQRIGIESALRIASIDQYGAPARCRPVDYLDTVEWLLEDKTLAEYRRLEQQVSDDGETVERKLSDFGGGASA